MSASSIHELLERERLRQGISLAELAERTKIAPEHLADLPRGGGHLSTAKLRRLAAALQLDPEALLRGEHVSAPEPVLFFRQLGIPDFNEADRPVLARCLDRARALNAIDTILGRTNRLRSAIPPGPVGAVPFQDGYRAANNLRRLLDLPTQPIGDIAALLNDELGTLIEVVPLRSSRVEAVTVKDPREGVSLVVLNANRHDPVRFPLGARVTLAHELAHLLLDEGAEDSIYLYADLARSDEAPQVNRDTSPVEQRANAFHAEFLMPLPGLRALLGPPSQIYSPIQADALVDRVRGVFSTPAPLTINHLANHKFILNDEDLRHGLMQAAAQRPTPGLPATNSYGRRDVLHDRVREAHEHSLITDGRARELLSLSPWDALPWEPEAV